MPCPGRPAWRTWLAQTRAAATAAAAATMERHGQVGERVRRCAPGRVAVELRVRREDPERERRECRERQRRARGDCLLPGHASSIAAAGRSLVRGSTSGRTRPPSGRTAYCGT